MRQGRRCGIAIPWTTWGFPSVSSLPPPFFSSFVLYSLEASKANSFLSSPLLDEYESYSTPVSAATTFLFSLTSNRTKTTFLPILGFINSVLRACVVWAFHHASHPEKNNITFLFWWLDRHGPAEQRFGALNMTAALGPYIMRHPEVKNNMEHFMLQFVSPELSSPEPYLRAIVSYLSILWNLLLRLDSYVLIGPRDPRNGNQKRVHMVKWRIT